MAIPCGRESRSATGESGQRRVSWMQEWRRGRDRGRRPGRFGVNGAVRAPYEGRRVVVTGCASGMGQETARQLVDLGAHVVGLDLREPSVPVKEFCAVDLSDPASIDAAVSAIGGPVHGLFNVAGISPGRAPLKVIAVNFLGTRT